MPSKQVESLPVAIVAVVVRDAKTLVIRRRPGPSHPGYLGGVMVHLAPGEAETSSLVSGLHQQLGIEVRPIRQVWECLSQRQDHDLHWWLAEYVSGELVVDEGTLNEAVWVTPSEFATLNEAFANDRKLWWAHISNILTSALAESGVERGRAIELSKIARRQFLESSRWVVFEDSIEALELVHRNGWQNAILSNHVPELDDLVARLGLDSVMDAVITSARTGFEKPHPQAYRVAMEQLGQPNHAWMIGDNPIADVAGAKRAGLQAILVRNPDFDDESRRFISESWGGSDWLDWENHVDRRAGDALEAASMILASEDTTGSV